MSTRVDPYVNLPVDMQPNVRRALVDILRRHAIQINWATGQDNTAISGDSVVAHDLVTVDAASGGVTCTLPAAADWRDRIIRVKKIDATGNTVTISAQSGETIDGQASAGISVQYDCLQCMSNGQEWLIV